MTLKAFLFLFAVTVVAVVSSAFIAERVFDPGFERGILIAILSGLVVFPAARWAEYRGWIRGEWSPGSPLRKQQEAARLAAAAQAADAQAAGQQRPAETMAPAHGTPQDDRHGTGSPLPPAIPPGDPR